MDNYINADELLQLIEEVSLQMATYIISWI